MAKDASVQNNNVASPDEIDRLVLTEYPYPIAANYRRILDANSWEQKTRDGLLVFEYAIRAITLGILSQYLIQDPQEVNDPELNRQLYQRKMTNISLGKWVEYLFLTLKAYGGKRDLFFMQELYDLYWDETRGSLQQRKGIRGPFDRLVEMRNILMHKTTPRDEVGWQEFGTEVLKNLRQVMASLSFLQNYDLIRIARVQGSEYEYERFTGQEITRCQEELNAKGKLQPGWFYLSRTNRTLVGLHPLLISWSSHEGDRWMDGKEPTEPDVAVFEGLSAHIAEYISTVLRKVVTKDDKEDAALISQLRDLIYYSLEHIKMARQQVSLSWETIWKIAREATAEQLGPTKKKYDPALYLQRQAIFEQFEDFLHSDKSCFVLTGKSGVGKSNFVLSRDAFAGDPNTTVLMYDAGRLTAPGSIIQMISQDLGKAIHLEEAALTDLFAELDRNQDMSDKKVIVIFDAINENVNPCELLQKIDQMVGHERYPWLKVVITSRPEGWRVMKRGISLDEVRYYRRQGAEETTIELEEFTVKMELFERSELEAVYENYRHFYHLQTEYAALKPALRAALRDPLVLRLVAESYRDQSIPARIQLNEIYWLYVNTLLNTGRIYQQDLEFLERELMPLMLKPGYYENRLTASQVQSARTREGRPLWELLHNDDMFSTGQRVNDSYTRLLNAEILVETGFGLDYVISFKYERFYEFFAGRRLYQSAREVPDPADFYTDMAEHLGDKVFLWGALVQAMVLELKEKNFALLGALAESTTGNRLLRSALVEALARFGSADPVAAEAGIRSMLGKLAKPPRTIFGEAWRLLRPAKDDFAHPQPRKRVAVEAAARLQLTGLLEEAAVQPSPWLRSLVAQNAFYLWKQNHAAGLKVVEGLSTHVRGKHGLPDMGAAESMLALTVAILGFDHEDPATLESLKTLGRKALRRLLYLADTSKTPGFFGRMRKWGMGLFYNFITGTLFRFALSIVKGWGENTNASLDALNHFYKLPVAKKQLVRSLIPYVDYEKAGLESRVADLIAVEDLGDFLSQQVIEFSIIGHGVSDFDRTLAVVNQMIDYCLKDRPPRFWGGGPVYALSQSAKHVKNFSPELTLANERVVTAIQEDPAAWYEQTVHDRPVPLPTDSRVSFMGTALCLHCWSTNQYEVPELVQKYLDRAMKDKDDDYLESWVAQEMQITFETEGYRIAIAGLKPLAQYRGEGVRTDIVNLLVRARNYDPEYIEDLLLRGDFPPEIANRVLASPTTERLNDLLTYQLIVIIYDLFILGPKSLRNELKWLLLKCTEMSSFQNFIILIIREILNMVLGEVVFNVPADAPSRGLRGKS